MKSVKRSVVVSCRGPDLRSVLDYDSMCSDDVVVRLASNLRPNSLVDFAATGGVNRIRALR